MTTTYLTTRTVANTDRLMIAPMTFAEIIACDLNLLRREVATARTAGDFFDYEFRHLAPTDDMLRYNLWKRRCSDATATPERSAAYHRPSLVLLPMENDGLSFAEAMDAVVAPHSHDYITETVGAIDKITGTGRKTITRRCACGHTTTRVIERRWSGD